MNASCLYSATPPLGRPGCLLTMPHCADSSADKCAAVCTNPTKWQDPLVVLSRDREPTHCLRNLLAGGSAFLLCGGPSANNEPLELLATRGCWTLGVNNVAGHPRIRPQAFVCSDPPSKFSHSIWLDPAIMKLVPTPKLSDGYRGSLRKKVNGSFERLDRKTPDCPNVWAFQRYSWLTPDDQFFQADGACWGNHKKGADATAQPKTVCTMLLGMRLLYYLGARTIYLVGVDFRMTEQQGYSFGQTRNAEAAAGNNAIFATVNGWLTQMEEKEVFKKFGLRVYNTFERSGLRAFPYVPFKEAVTAARGIIETTPDLVGWYEK